MVGYHGDAERNAEAMAGGYYHTGDVGSRDADGYITYVGRADDVFKASRLPDLPVRAGERAHRAPGGGRGGRRAVARPGAARRARRRTSCWPPGTSRPRRRRGRSSSSPRDNLAPYKRIRRLEFAELPKTISGKIRRVELRGREAELHADAADLARRRVHALTVSAKRASPPDDRS